VVDRRGRGGSRSRQRNNRASNGRNQNTA